MVDAVPVAGIALLLGVDRFMAEIRAATNLTSNIIATLVVGRWVDGIDMKTANAELQAGFVEPRKRGPGTVMPATSGPCDDASTAHLPTIGNRATLTYDMP
ncbi:MAG: hypothetical protein WDN50_18020 [Bradyrhizobium sp.]